MPIGWLRGAGSWLIHAVLRSTLSPTSGNSQMTASRIRAGPSGIRRPCSQLRTNAGANPNLAANWAWLRPGADEPRAGGRGAPRRCGCGDRRLVRAQLLPQFDQPRTAGAGLGSRRRGLRRLDAGSILDGVRKSKMTLAILPRSANPLAKTVIWAADRTRAPGISLSTGRVRCTGGRGIWPSSSGRCDIPAGGESCSAGGGESSLSRATPS